MTLDEILKNIRGAASGAYNAFKSGQTPAQFITPKVVNPIADAIRGPVSPIPDYGVINTARDVASQTFRDIGNSIPQIGTSMLRASPAGQAYEYGKTVPTLDFSNPSSQSNLDKIQARQNILRKQQSEDLWNSLQGLSYVPSGGLVNGAAKVVGEKALGESYHLDWVISNMVSGRDPREHG
jgi:hypothetical protein